MTLAREEVFGPILNVMRMDDLDHAIEAANKSAYGNGAAIFTHSGKAAREFKHRVKAGMVGINVGVPATMAMFPFTGWDDSFYGDLHIQGRKPCSFTHAAESGDDAVVWDGVGDVSGKNRPRITDDSINDLHIPAIPAQSAVNSAPGR
jgi:malonate-semialdehyde dehydrogenase (acetylating)/methylmalonate-semialdehyde dehydrogenase